MSDYERQKVVRYKLTEEDLKHFEAKNGYELRDKFEQFLDSWAAKGKGYFVHAITESPNFLDFVLIDEDGYGDYGKTRKLSENELNKYYLILARQFREMDASRGVKEDDPWLPNGKNFRLVDFCWYNCSEAPDYFDEKNDPFYDEV